MQIHITAPDATGRQNVLLEGLEVGYFEPTVGANGGPAFRGYYIDPVVAPEGYRRGDSRMHTVPDAARYVVMCYVRCNATVQEI